MFWTRNKIVIENSIISKFWWLESFCSMDYSKRFKTKICLEEHSTLVLKITKYITFYIPVFKFVRVKVHDTMLVAVRRQLPGQGSLPLPWLLGIKLRLSSLMAGAFYLLSHPTSLHSWFTLSVWNHLAVYFFILCLT